MPLDDILQAESIDTSVYNKMALSAFNADGKQYGVPNSFSNVVLIYNKDLFEQAGMMDAAPGQDDDVTGRKALLA